MSKRSNNKIKETKKANAYNFKSIILMTIFAVSLFASVIRADAADQEPEPRAEAAVGVEISATTMMCAVRNVSVMKEPNTESETLGELVAGTNIFAVELTGEGWYRVVYGGETGYIMGDSLAVYENMDAWLASEPEPEFDPITEPDNAAGESQAGEQSKGNNAFTVLVIITLVISIFGYAVIQIVKDNKNPDAESEKTSEDESKAGVEIDESKAGVEIDESKAGVEITDLDEDE